MCHVLCMESVLSLVNVLGRCPILGCFPYCSFYGKCPILVTAPKLQEDWMGTQSDQSESMLIKPRYEDIGYCSVKSRSLLKPGATRCHGTRIARGVPLPVYNNLDLFSGFWCTSHCVVFKYSVPPLTDQALRKVLLTS